MGFVWVMLSSWEISVTFTYSSVFYCGLLLINMLCECFHSVMCQFVRREIVLRAVHTAGTSWALLWAGRTVGKDSTVPFCDKLNEGKSCLAYSLSQFSVKAVHICPSIFAQAHLFLIVPWQNYQPTNQGRRVDCGKKPELSLGSYEILEKQTVRNGMDLFWT